MSSENKYKEEYGISPIDNTFVNINESSMKSIEQQSVDVEGYSLKGKSVDLQLETFQRSYQIEVLLSLVRNVLCWTALICIIVMLAEGKDSQKIEAYVLILAIICLSIGVGFHITRGYYDLTFKNPTIVNILLRDAISKEDFIRVMQQRQLSAPEVIIQVSLKDGSPSFGEASHWSRKGRKKTKEIVYNGWADQSSPINSISFREEKSHYITILKDYRCVDEDTQKSINNEIAEFKSETGYDQNFLRLTFEVLLQWKEADSSADIQSFLVYDGMKALIYQPLLYRISWFCALDSIYRIIFHLNTQSLDNYYLVKFIER